MFETTALAASILGTLLLVFSIRREATIFEAKAENTVKEKKSIIDEHRAKTFLIMNLKMGKRMKEKYELSKGVSESMKAFSERLSKLGPTTSIDSYVRTIEDMQLPSELSFMYQMDEEDIKRLLTVVNVSRDIELVSSIFTRIADKTTLGIVSGSIFAIAAPMFTLLSSLIAQNILIIVGIVALGIYYTCNGPLQLYPLNEMKKALKRVEKSTRFTNIETNTRSMFDSYNRISRWF